MTYIAKARAGRLLALEGLNKARESNVVSLEKARQRRRQPAPCLFMTRRGENLFSDLGKAVSAA